MSNPKYFMRLFISGHFISIKQTINKLGIHILLLILKLLKVIFYHNLITS